MEHGGRSGGERHCLMVVDDDSTIREMLLIALGGRYNVICLPTGDDVVELVASYEPDLLILDINLPGRDGFAICSQVRSQAALRGLPVLFVTVRGDDKSFMRSLQVGGASYLTKPFEMSALNERIEYLLRSYSALN